PRGLRAYAARNGQALIDAAEQLFATRGLSVTLDDIAAAAGVNVATAYRHFSNKHELAAAWLRQKIEQPVELAEQAAADPDPWHGLSWFLQQVVQLMTDNRGMADLVSTGAEGEAFAELQTRLDPLLERLLERGRAAGVIRPELTPQDLGVVLRMLKSVTEIPDADGEGLARRYLPLLLAGLRPAAEPLDGAPPSNEQLRVAMTTRPGC
ncbi:MAG: TetR/AcrR family transcriptional regulator, partial [Jatrophihabitans sp.]|uniref:TetR/AcrR family transcriptional regulator n=1 Tax=Jatrophihabitans sp. TaxID=1932789 RepID=UPI003F7F8AB9